MKIPAQFPKWDPAVDGLEDAGRWAMEIERSRLPPDTVFPRAGQVWEAIQDCEVSFHCFIRLLKPGFRLSPPFPFGRAKLQRGEQVRILEVGPKPITVHFRPLRYDELQESIVPEEIRRSPWYNGYTLHLKTAKTISDCWLPSRPAQAFFNEVFHLVEDATSA